MLNDRVRDGEVPRCDIRDEHPGFHNLLQQTLLVRIAPGLLPLLALDSIVAAAALGQARNGDGALVEVDKDLIAPIRPIGFGEATQKTKSDSAERITQNKTRTRSGHRTE